MPLAQSDLLANPAGGLFLLAVLGVFGLMAAVFSRLRHLRREVADELKREMQHAAKAARVDVQSPLEVKAHTEFVAREDHKRDVGEIRDELKRHAARRAEIYDTLKEQSSEIRSLKSTNEQQSSLLSEVRQDMKSHSSKVDTMIGEQRQLSQQIHQLTLAMQRQHPTSR